VSGRKLVLWLLGTAVAVSGFFAWQAMKMRRQLGAVAQSAGDLPAVRQTSTGEMRLVPFGSFQADQDRIPVMLPAFYIDRTEVTNEAYARFAAATGHPGPVGDPALPVVNVNFDEAKEFCGWAGKRLPLPLEWEKAARGTEGFVYPWGNEPDASRMAGALKPADSMPQGASPYGALHMGGNVWEWVDEAVKPKPRNIEVLGPRLTPAPTAEERWYLARGGAFDQPVSDARTFTFLPLPARYRAADLGFRCAENPGRR
jgi:eukaryotic-like serine/threonine-protein kinase